MNKNSGTGRFTRFFPRVRSLFAVSIGRSLRVAIWAILSYLRAHHLNLVTAIAALLACYFTFASVSLMRQSAAKTGEQLRLAREQLQLFRDNLALARKQLDSLQAYQKEALAKPDLAVRLECPFERRIRTKAGRWPTVKELYVAYGTPLLCVVTVENVGGASAKNAIVWVTATRYFDNIASPLSALEQPSPDPRQQLFRYQARALYPRDVVTLPFPVKIKTETPDGAPQISVRAEADNLTRHYEYWFVFRTQK